MQVGVITPYFQEPLEILRRCHESVRDQTHPGTHFLVADGFPRPEVAQWALRHIVLAQPHQDCGNTPRAIGSLSAMNLGFDAIACLDADNWYYPDHLAAMVDLHRRTGAAVCTASRTIHRLDGSFMFADRLECDGRKHVDTSCFFFTRPAFCLLPLWAMMPPQLGPICDLVMWQFVQSLGLPTAHYPRPTVAFRSQYDVHYQALGETPPPGTKSARNSTQIAINWWWAQPVAARAYYAGRMGFRPSSPAAAAWLGGDFQLYRQ